MLILCYGITKSGSTLAFELVKGMLASAGHAQDVLPGGVVFPGKKINFISKVNRDVIDRLLAAIPDDRMIAVKTHAMFDRETFAYLEGLQAERKVQAIASYRDPRDICLSLIDANARARLMGKDSWARATDLENTVPGVLRQLRVFSNWASMKGTLRLDYAVVAFAPDKAIDAIERFLGITSDRVAAKRHAFHKAFTQKNKAIPERHVSELSPRQKEEMDKVFGDFIERVCVANDAAWFSGYREVPARQHRRRRERGGAEADGEAEEMP
jgi:hypothetical protein